MQDLIINNRFKSLIPPQRPDEHQLLEDSLLKNGYDPAYPVIFWNHTIIDGHNRYEICQKQNIPFTTSEKFFDNEHEVINWIIDNQLSRRNITDDQRAYLIGKRYKEEKKAIGANSASIKEQVKQINKHVIPHNEEVIDDKSTSAKIAEQSKVSHATVERAEKFADAVDKVAENTGINPQKILSGAINASRRDIQNVSRLEPEQQKKVFEKIEKKEAKNVKDAVKEVKQEEIEEIKDSIVLPDPIKIINGDFREVYPTLKKESIDFIITDPPYPKEYLPLYEDLAKCAEHVLKPGGSLLMMVGQSYLPEIMNMTVPYIQYHWTLGYFTLGGQSAQLWTKKVNTFWKPVLWFTKGEFKGEWIGDVIKSDNNDKRFHEWGQSESGMYDLMKRFVKPGDIVLDPFMGGGTTGIVCKTLKCEFVGVELSIDTFNRAKVRLGD